MSVDDAWERALDRNHELLGEAETTRMDMRLPIGEALFRAAALHEAAAQELENASPPPHFVRFRDELARFDREQAELFRAYAAASSPASSAQEARAIERWLSQLIDRDLALARRFAEFFDGARL